MRIADTLRGTGLEMYKPWIVDEYPLTKLQLANKVKAFAQGTNRQVRVIDFAIAEFSTKSRTVFYQTLTALENKVPVLCVLREGQEENIPSGLKMYTKDYLTIKKYRSHSDLEDLIVEYLEDLNPPKKRFNVVLSMKSLREFEQVTDELGISKAELIRRLIAKEFKSVFDE